MVGWQTGFPEGGGKKKKNKKPWLVAFANFYGINTPTIADFKLLM